MRVLQVNKFLYRRGGAEAYMEDAAALLAAAGHEVHFWGMAHPENTHLEHADTFPSNMELEPPPAGVPAKLRAAARMVWSREARRGMEAVLDRVRPDVVHLHNIYHQLSPSVLAPLRERGIPAVMTLHDYKLACPIYLMLHEGRVCEACVTGGFRQAVVKRCKGGSLTASALSAGELRLHTTLRAYGPVQVFACPSRFIAGKMTEARVFPDRLRVLPLPVELDSGPRKQLPGGPVVYVGRLSEEKGADVLVRAARDLPPGTEVLIAGAGPQREQLEALAAEQSASAVRFLGRVPREEVARLVASAAVVAVPSRCYENQPLSVLEAFAAGTPVVGSALGGIAELVDPGRSGLLVPPDDPAALAGALTEVLRDPDAGLAMGRAGRRAVEAAHAPAVHLAGLEDLYQQAMSAVGRQRSTGPVGRAR